LWSACASPLQKAASGKSPERPENSLPLKESREGASAPSLSFEQVTPLGIDIDRYCLGRGTTTAVDAGSAGRDTFPGFRAFAAERFRTRLLAFLHISRTGLSFAGLGGDSDTPGEVDSLRFAKADDCAVRWTHSVAVAPGAALAASPRAVARRSQWHSAPVDRQELCDGRINNPPYGSLRECLARSARFAGK